MKVQLVHARLSLRDAEELGGCLPKLNAIYDSVKATGIAGKASVLAQCEEVYHALERVIGKEMAAVARFQQRSEAGSSGQSSPEIPAAVTSDQAENVALGEPSAR